MKYILVIGDGMADNPVKELDGLTPIEKANIPFIDSLAARGELYRVRTVPHGAVPGSDTANMSIFGCDPNTYYTGRAPLEAASTGIFMPAGSAAYRCNMIAVSQEDKPYEDLTIVSHSSGSISGDEADEAVTWLFNDPVFKKAADAAKITVYPANSYRHIAVQESVDIKGISLIPPHDHLGGRVGDYKPSGNPNAEVLWDLMVLAHERLKECPVNIERVKKGQLPANSIWFWAEGTAVELPKFKYTDKGTIISAVPLFKGIARLTGLKTVDVPGATGLLNTNYQGKVDAAVKVLIEGDDFAAVHIEAPDECSHDGDLAGKIQAIENLDALVVKPLCDALSAKGEDFRLMIISDHKTLIDSRAHDGDPVPCIIYDSRKDTGRGGAYTEKDADPCELIDPGTGVMDLLFR